MLERIILINWLCIWLLASVFALYECWEMGKAQAALGNRHIANVGAVSASLCLVVVGVLLDLWLCPWVWLFATIGVAAVLLVMGAILYTWGLSYGRKNAVAYREVYNERIESIRLEQESTSQREKGRDKCHTRVLSVT